jgi:hypothetical protein
MFALSCASCVVVAALWVGSYFSLGEFDFVLRARLWRFTSWHGTAAVDDQPQLWIDAGVNGIKDSQYRTLSERWHRLERSEFAHDWPEVARKESSAIQDRMWRTPPAPTRTYPPITRIQLPYWGICAALAMPLVLRGNRRLKEKRRIAQGICRRCGYDLRASSERCPECGTPFQASTVALTEAK